MVVADGLVTEHIWRPVMYVTIMMPQAGRHIRIIQVLVMQEKFAIVTGLILG